ncbi:MAG TPA: iron chelate uptake ABC transporter family permease subunit, partial [Armatimonadota bacterium]|nr:iron chelate uptake ABC transporter family permease subunit [Armatimonadota bacterium]
MRTRLWVVALALLAVMVAVALLSLSLGAASVPPAKAGMAVLASLPGLGSLAPELNDAERTIIFDLRLPRLVLALLVGASLAMAGVVMQALFQNPMAAPSIIGVSAGGALGATAAIMLGFNFWLWRLSSMTVSAFVGALAVTAVVYLLSRRGGRTPVGVLLLTGIAVGAMASAASSFILIAY